MARVFDGYAVELSKQVLKSGACGSPDCEWDWNSEYHYFVFEEDAERYFAKQRKFYPETYQMVRMSHCTIAMDGANPTDYDLGDAIKEYVTEDGEVVVWEM